MAVKTAPIAGHAAAKRDKPARPKNALPRVVFIVGQTSAGKTALSLRLAKHFSGEIINADARQIYKELTIGTGKPYGKRGTFEGHAAFLYEGIPHYLMDFLPPEEIYSAPEWKEAAQKAITGIVKRGRIPFIVGGTGLYIASLVDNFEFPEVEAQPELRKAYEAKPLEELVTMLLALDPQAKNIVDLKNKRRVIRALEVVTFTGKPFSELRKKGEPLVDALMIGIKRPQEEIYERIDASIERMLDQGLVDEVRRLLKKGIADHSPGFSAIGYQDFARYLRGEVSLDEAIRIFKKKTKMYSRRQWTWFKKDPRISWVESEEEAETLVLNWLKQAP